MKPLPAPRRTRRFDSLAQEAYLNLWRTYDRLKAHEDRLFEEHGLSAQQYNALRLLRSAAPEPLSVQSLGRRLISRAPDMTRLLDRLDEAGWIVRARRLDNRRVVDVTITPAGLALLDQLDEPVQECHQRQLGHLSAEPLRHLIGLLVQARSPHEDDDSHWKPRPARGSSRTSSS